MIIQDSRSSMAAMAAGTVFPSWVSKRRSERLPAVHNRMSYSAADAVAAAYGGDTSLVPSRIGFLYCKSGGTTWLSDISGRDMSWVDLGAEIRRSNGDANLLVCGFSYAPTVEGGSVTFHSVTRSGADGSYPFGTDAPYCGPLGKGDYMLHVVLLGGYDGCGGDPLVLARASLAGGSNDVFRQKPDGYELAVDWKVEFF